MIRYDENEFKSRFPIEHQICMEFLNKSYVNREFEFGQADTDKYEILEVHYLLIEAGNGSVMFEFDNQHNLISEPELVFD